MKQLFGQIELRFWNVIISLLTRSQSIRFFISKAYGVFMNEQLKRQVALITVISCAGFATGMLAYSLSLIIS